MSTKENTMTSRLRILPTALTLIALVAAFSLPASASDADKASEKRAKIQQNTKEALAELFKESPKAKELYAKAYGYAVFSNTKVSLGLTGGGGSGEAVEKATGKKTYMRMGTAGLNLGLGAQKYKVVFLFEDSVSFKSFVDKGWQAEGGANAVAGTAGANADPSFRQGMAVFTLTDGGLMLQADISGTKYWKSDDLN
jgi:lipid-binding SYLF domain-containing protein